MTKVQAHVQEMMEERVKDMVNAQLNAAGFDQDLTAADLMVRRSALASRAEDTVEAGSSSYAGVAATKVTGTRVDRACTSKSERQETSFLLARRSLRLWPVPGGSKERLEDYMKTKLRLSQTFIEEELGAVALSRPKEPKNRNKDEYIAVFESKHIRDAVKAAAPNLANFRETAGMRLHIPDHLQRSFQALMNLSFDLKKRHPTLKRNVKFDEEDGGLYMDIKLNDEAEWRRVKPDQAAAANKERRADRRKDLREEDLRSLLDGSDEEE